MITRRQLLLLSTAAFAGPLRAQTTTPIRIGEINSYSTIPQFTVPYRMGWQLAVEEINAAGGLIGRKVEVISRDDAGKPDDAIRLATELVSNEKVVLLTGTFLSNVGLAVAEFALHNKVLLAIRARVSMKHLVGRVRLLRYWDRNLRCPIRPDADQSQTVNAEVFLPRQACERRLDLRFAKLLIEAIHFRLPLLGCDGATEL